MFIYNLDTSLLNSYYTIKAFTIIIILFFTHLYTLYLIATSEKDKQTKLKDSILEMIKKIYKNPIYMICIYFIVITINYLLRTPLLSLLTISLDAFNISLYELIIFSLILPATYLLGILLQIVQGQFAINFSFFYVKTSITGKRVLVCLTCSMIAYGLKYFLF